MQRHGEHFFSIVVAGKALDDVAGDKLAYVIVPKSRFHRVDCQGAKLDDLTFARALWHLDLGRRHGSPAPGDGDHHFHGGRPQGPVA